MFRNILVSIDGSPHARQALSEAIDIAQAENSRLTLITSVRCSPVWAYSPATAAAAEPLKESFQEEAKEAMRNAVERVPQSIGLTKIVTHEPIRPALMKQIEAGHHDLLVMGSRGRGAVASSVLGSVSHYALNHSPIPVLIVHAHEDESPEARAVTVTPLAAASAP
jgi:nucleotide-binding universal stress UspA family protein